jgi:hypothetical protein
MLGGACQADDCPPSLVQSDTPALAGGGQGLTADHVARRQQCPCAHNQHYLWGAHPAKAPCYESCLSVKFVFFFAMHVDFSMNQIGSGLRLHVIFLAW